MNYLSIDYLILYAFLAVILVIGLFCKRPKNIREFAIGSGQHGVGLLVMTFLATNTAVFEEISIMFSEGIIIMAALSGLIIPFMIRALWIAPKMKYFKHCISMADVMGDLYGVHSRIITGLLGTLYSICMIGMGLFVFGFVCETILNIDRSLGVFIGGLIATLYTIHGGIISVVKTDVAQFLALFIVVVILAITAVNHVGGIDMLISAVPKEKFKVFSHEKFPLYLTLFLCWSIFSIGITSSALFQRLLMAKDGRTIRNQYFAIAAIDSVMHVLFTIIGLAGIVLFPKISANNIVPHMVNELLPIGFKGLAMAGMIAIIMGSVDSYLHAAGILLTHDVIKPICDIKKVKINELKLVKYMIFLISVFTILVALKANDVLQLSFSAIRFTGPIIMFPLMAGILGLKPDKKSFFIAMWATIAAFILSKMLLPTAYSYYGTIISILTNIITFLTSHYIQNQGFAVVIRDKSKCEQKPLEFEIFNPFHLAAYARTKAEQFGTPYIAFGAFFLVAFDIILFFWDVVPPEYFIPVIWLKIVGGCMSVFLIAQERWFDSFRKYLPLFWYITLGFAMPFTGMFMLLITNGDIQWFVQIMAGVGILFVFIDMVGFLGIFTTSIVAALLVYVCWLKGSIHVNLHIDSQYSIIWQAIFGACAFAYFLRNRQKEWEKFHLQQAVLGATYRRDLLQTAQESSRMAKALENAGVGGLCNVAIKIKNYLNEEDKKEDKSPLFAEFMEATSKLTNIALEVRDIEQRAVEHLLLSVTKDSVADMINNVMHDLDSLNAKENVSFYNKSTKKTIKCDFEKIRTVLTNSVIFAKSFVKDEEIYVVVDDATLNYPINTADNRFMNLDAIRFIISTPEYPESETDLITYKSEMQPTHIEIPKQEMDLPLSQNKRIIRAHYGFSSSEIIHDRCKQVYVIPQDLRKVRPTEMDKGEMLLAEDTPSPRFDSTAERKELELIDQIQYNAPKVKIERVKAAIQYIKKSHATTNRLSGEPYYLHPIAVAKIVMDYDCSEDIILGALLHDTIEDTATNAEVITLLFGEKVAKIVIDLTNIECNIGSCYRLKLSSIDNILQLLAVRDKRSLYIKIADRLHNLRTISHKDIDSQLRKAEETILFYVPLAEQLEMKSIAEEMRGISIKVLNDGGNHETKV